MLRTVSLVMLFLLSSNYSAYSETTRIKVGVILPLSGAFADIGKSIQEGLNSAVNTFNDSKIDLIYEDDQFNSKESIRSYHRLVSIKKVNIIVSTAAPVVEPLLPLVEKDNIILISLWDYQPKFQQPDKGLFSLGFSNEKAGRDIANFILSFKKINKIAIIDAHDHWSKTVSNSAKTIFTANQKLLAVHETVMLEESNFSPIISKIKAKKVDAIFFPLYMGSLSSLIRQTKELNYSGMLFTGEGMFPEDIKQLGNNSCGVWYQRIWPNTKENYSLNKPGYLGFHAMGNDLGMVFNELEKKINLYNKKIDQQFVIESLKKVEFTGKFGEINLSSLKEPGKSLQITQECR